MGSSCLDENEAKRVLDIVRASPILGVLLSHWSTIALPNCWLSGSAIAQTVWNDRFGLDHGIADIDLVYFEPLDLSEISESQQTKRISGLFLILRTKLTLKTKRECISGMVPNTAIT